MARIKSICKKVRVLFISRNYDQLLIQNIQDKSVKNFREVLYICISFDSCRFSKNALTIL